MGLVCTSCGRDKEKDDESFQQNDNQSDIGAKSPITHYIGKQRSLQQTEQQTLESYKKDKQQNNQDPVLDHYNKRTGVNQKQREKEIEDWKKRQITMQPELRPCVVYKLDFEELNENKKKIPKNIAEQNTKDDASLYTNTRNTKEIQNLDLEQKQTTYVFDQNSVQNNFLNQSLNNSVYLHENKSNNQYKIDLQSNERHTYDAIKLNNGNNDNFQNILNQKQPQQSSNIRIDNNQIVNKENLNNSLQLKKI